MHKGVSEDSDAPKNTMSLETPCRSAGKNVEF